MNVLHIKPPERERVMHVGVPCLYRAASSTTNAVTEGRLTAKSAIPSYRVISSTDTGASGAPVSDRVSGGGVVKPAASASSSVSSSGGGGGGGGAAAVGDKDIDRGVEDARQGDVDREDGCGDGDAVNGFGGLLDAVSAASVGLPFPAPNGYADHPSASSVHWASWSAYG